ncbi:hypothetical protein AB0940_31840 [Streptomyces sp. NPDC006656]|uniref:hypothetical protein n=1 Tax=Streptomyces sp. NPDC006656 TaxID=3156899 RepID=UPI003455B890
MSTFEQDVLNELGADRVADIAGAIDSDEAGARRVVEEIASALADAWSEAGEVSGGAKALAGTVAKRTGIPQATISSIMEMVVPVARVAAGKRAATSK